MAITLKKKNFAKSTLAADISDIDTSLTVATGDGVKFPSDGPFRAVLWDSSYGSPDDDPGREIVEATLSSGDTFTIVRAQEGTVAKAWSAGAQFTHVLTAGTLVEIEDEITSRPAFSAHKNATNQTIPTDIWTKLTWNAEEFDTNGDFDLVNGVFTPTVAGKYLLIAIATLQFPVDQAIMRLCIYKNGSSHVYGVVNGFSGTNWQGTIVSGIVDANGTTDYFEVYAKHTCGVDKDIDGASAYFMGCRIE
jgi:hypothetical protein